MSRAQRTLRYGPTGDPGGPLVFRGARVIPDYSIVIPAYDEQELLPGTLASVARAMAAVTRWTGEVVVVDNASRDRTADIARASGAYVVHEPHRQIARARNAGAAASRGRWLVFLDADTRLSGALLAATTDALAGGRIAAGGAPIDFGRSPTAFLAALLRVFRAVQRRLGWAAGCYLFCRRDAFEAVGGFDERLYATEELALSHALRRWARRRGLVMRVLGVSVSSSDRKLTWFSQRRIAWASLLFAVAPWRLGRREACWLWYERPAPRA